MATPVNPPLYEKRTQIREAIGELCMIWSGIEWMLDLVLAKLLSLNEVEAAAINQSSGLVSKRCELMLKLCQNGQRERISIERLILTLSFIHQELSPKRNRYVHDIYIFNNNSIVRSDRRISFKSLETRMPKQFHFGLKEDVSLEEIEEFNGKCMRALLELRDFALNCD